MLRFAGPPVPLTVRQQRRRNDITTAMAFGGVIVLMAFLMRMANNRGWFAVAFAGLLIVCTLGLFRPRAGIYSIAFFTLLGDATTVPWYPFTKNLSSRESVLFVADAFTISPLEIALGATVCGWLLQVAARRQWTMRRGDLFAAVAVFTAFVMVGFVYGVGRGGDMVVAVWEVRPLLYILPIYLLITNLCTTTKHYNTLGWCLALGIIGQALLSLDYLRGLTAVERDQLESLTEHSSAIQMNAMFVFAFALLTFRRCSIVKRFFLTLAILPVGWVFVVSQRRAGVIALLIGFVVLAIALFVQNRRAFWIFVPIALLAGAGYTAAFWNSESTFAFGAQAIKGVIAPEQLGAEDQSSDLYREIESYDLVSTIRSSPLTGLGFGQKFHRPIPLPDISFFIFYEYIPHNSILWIWIKVGFVGFVSMLVLVANSIRTGLRAVMRLPGGDHAALTLMALAYIPMYIVFAYVDIAWDARSTLFFGAALAICANATRVWRDEHPDEPAEPRRRISPARERALVGTSA